MKLIWLLELEGRILWQNREMGQEGSRYLGNRATILCIASTVRYDDTAQKTTSVLMTEEGALMKNVPKLLLQVRQVSEKTHAALNGGFGGTAFYISTEDNTETKEVLEYCFVISFSTTHH